ncbi:uncharacterized protein YALI1_B01568g [Yarrowia lipolytica]|uniref:Uncharacterized protein n=1 Tax=Yarrowia lipolytica TaxID=4952 RepID=A0A1D8N5X5_YARLL|nr:hypothetical protein YALI1_B01568g [Yarrowia lipolytica]
MDMSRSGAVWNHRAFGNNREARQDYSDHAKVTLTSLNYSKPVSSSIKLLNQLWSDSNSLIASCTDYSCDCTGLII